MANILVIEDDCNVSTMIKSALEKNNEAKVEIASYGKEGYSLSKIANYDLIILDIMLPDMDGYKVLKMLRNSEIDMPVLILSSLDSSSYRVKGLDLGADDFLNKPFDIRELEARVRAIIRRRIGKSNMQISIGDLLIDFSEHQTFHKGKEIKEFTLTEQKILERLVQKRNHTVTKQELYNALYTDLDSPEIRVVDVFICKIRRKLAKYCDHPMIITIWGRGYIMRDS